MAQQDAPNLDDRAVGHQDTFGQPETVSQPDTIGQPETFSQPDTIGQRGYVGQQDTIGQPETVSQPDPSGVRDTFGVERENLFLFWRRGHQQPPEEPLLRR